MTWRRSVGTKESLDNMPEGLKAGPVGEILRGWVDRCERWAGELGAVDLEDLGDEANREQAVVDLQGCVHTG